MVLTLCNRFEPLRCPCERCGPFVRCMVTFFFTASCELSILLRMLYILHTRLSIVHDLDPSLLLRTLCITNVVGVYLFCRHTVYVVNLLNTISTLCNCYGPSECSECRPFVQIAVSLSRLKAHRANRRPFQERTFLSSIQERSHDFFVVHPLRGVREVHPLRKLPTHWSRCEPVELCVHYWSFSRVVYRFCTLHLWKRSVYVEHLYVYIVNCRSF